MRISKGIGTVIGMLLVIPVVWAFNISGDRWLSGTTEIYSGLQGEGPSGVSFQTAFQAAVSQWNNTDFSFQLNTQYRDPCTGLTGNGSGGASGSGDGINSVDFRDDVCGTDFGDDVLAVTLSFTQPGSLGFAYYRETDIIFNSNYFWDVYTGSLRVAVDFQRVALHELGHVLGLDHELSEPAIMAPKLGNIDTLTDDDIAGVSALYGTPLNCAISSLALNQLKHNSLASGDCRIMDLFNAGSDNSFVDTYKFTLHETTSLRVLMTSVALDSVVLVTDTSLSPLFILDDTPNGCDVNGELTLDAGEYYILANTYVRGSEKCFGNTGDYSIAVTQSDQPWLSTVVNSTGGERANALFTGGARRQGAQAFSTSFAASDRFDVDVTIAPDPLHVGREGHLFVLARLSDGRQFMKVGKGRFVAFKDALSSLSPLRSGTLQALETVNIVTALRGDLSGLSGLDFRIFTGYALADAPAEIHYSNPVEFSIAD